MTIAQVSKQYELSPDALWTQGDKASEARKQILIEQRALLLEKMKAMLIRK